MSDVRAMVSETVHRLLQSEVTKELLGRAEHGEWPAELWNALEANGLTQPMTPDGGGGEAGYVILHAAGRFGAPVPLAETLLAGWLLTRAGMPPPDGPLTVAAGAALALASGRISGTVARVPWGRQAHHVVVMVGAPPQIALLPIAAAHVQPDQNLAREPRDTLTFDGAIPLALRPASLPADAVLLYGALVRAVQMAGALEYLLAQSVQYANERIQFGQPIGKFQAVQQQIAVLAEETAAASVAAEVAFRAAERGEARFEIAVAKARISESVEIAANVAHAVHGAIGFTYEHPLQFATRRLWAWRAEFGSAAVWQRWLGAVVLARGADRLWDDLTAR